MFVFFYFIFWGRGGGRYRFLDGLNWGGGGGDEEGYVWIGWFSLVPRLFSLLAEERVW